MSVKLKIINKLLSIGNISDIIEELKFAEQRNVIKTVLYSVPTGLNTFRLNVYSTNVFLYDFSAAPSTNISLTRIPLPFWIFLKIRSTHFGRYTEGNVKIIMYLFIRCDNNYANKTFRNAFRDCGNYVIRHKYM